jgi:hypothetical protein
MKKTEKRVYIAPKSIIVSLMEEGALLVHSPETKTKIKVIESDEDTDDDELVAP